MDATQNLYLAFRNHLRRQITLTLSAAYPCYLAMGTQRCSSEVSRGYKYTASSRFCSKSSCAGSFLWFVLFLLEGNCSHLSSCADGDSCILQQYHGVVVPIAPCAHGSCFKKERELVKQLFLKILFPPPSTVKIFISIFLMFIPVLFIRTCFAIPVLY